MRYGEKFNKQEFEEEAASRLDMLTQLATLATEKQCSLTMDGMSAMPQSAPPAPPTSRQELKGVLQFARSIRKAVAAFFDNLPES